MSARETLYGRRGGGWTDVEPGQMKRELAELREAMGGDLRKPPADDDELAPTLFDVTLFDVEP